MRWRQLRKLNPVSRWNRRIKVFSDTPNCTAHCCKVCAWSGAAISPLHSASRPGWRGNGRENATCGKWRNWSSSTATRRASALSPSG
jgi:hypothetical protein